MRKILVTLSLAINSVFAIEVHDSMLFTQTMTMIKQTTDLIVNARQQLETLGGLKTITDETKNSIYQGKNALERSIGRLIDETQKLQETASADNMGKVVGSLTSTDPADFQNTPHNKGIFYENLKGMRDAGLENIGWYGENNTTRKLKEITESLKKGARALTKTKYQDFMKAIDETDQRANIKASKDGYKNNVISEMNSLSENQYLDINVTVNTERLKLLASEINNPDAKDIVQMQQLSNILLHEMIKELYSLRQNIAVLTYASTTHFSKNIKSQTKTYNDFQKQINIATHKINDEFADTDISKQHQKMCSKLQHGCSGVIGTIK